MPTIEEKQRLRYLIEQYPLPQGGMQSGYMPPGVRVTDTKTGRVAVCTEHRSQHLNKDACLKALADTTEEGGR